MSDDVHRYRARCAPYDRRTATSLHNERKCPEVARSHRNAELWPPTDERELEVEPGDTVASIRAFYEGIIRENRDILDGVTDLDSVADDVNGRWVLLHLIEELARHAGHADIICESIDGTKGP
jgi:uncharacterized protein DUF664